MARVSSKRRTQKRRSGLRKRRGGRDAELDAMLENGPGRGDGADDDAVPSDDEGSDDDDFGPHGIFGSPQPEEDEAGLPGDGGRRRRRRSSKRGAGKRRSTRRRRSSKRRGGKAPVSKGGKRKARKTRKSRR